MEIKFHHSAGDLSISGVRESLGGSSFGIQLFGPFSKLSRRVGNLLDSICEVGEGDCVNFSFVGKF
jgi:hypothetical protein